MTKADEWGSDVIFGRMVGVGGRNVDQRIFEKTEQDLDLIESDLAFALSNTKLYRRALIEQRDLHFSRDLRVGSDQPFTIDAVTHASRVSVLADYTYYYAVKREDETNISYSTRWRQRVADIGAVMDHVAALVDAGPTAGRVPAPALRVGADEGAQPGVPGGPRRPSRPRSSRRWGRWPTATSPTASRSGSGSPAGSPCGWPAPATSTTCAPWWRSRSR